MKDLSPEEIADVLYQAADGVLAFTDGKKPYGIPIGHVYVNDSVHFSILAKGRKWEMYQQNSNVCFSVFKWNDERTQWVSAIVEGEMVPITDLDQIEAVVRANIVKTKRDPDEHLEKRMAYYLDNADNPTAVKLFKIVASEVGGKRSSQGH